MIQNSQTLRNRLFTLSFSQFQLIFFGFFLANILTDVYASVRIFSHTSDFLASPFKTLLVLKVLTALTYFYLFNLLKIGKSRAYWVTLTLLVLRFVFTLASFIPKVIVLVNSSSFLLDSPNYLISVYLPSTFYLVLNGYYIVFLHTYWQQLHKKTK